MRRVRRDNTPGDVALMAVITKAMGAFLILMIMLVPYYTSDPAQAPGVDEMRQRLDKVTADVRTLIDQAGTVSTEDILERLKEALEELERARELVADLKARLDQASAVVRRLETELANANQSLAQARSRVAELEQTVARQESELQRQATQIASLQAENERLRRELEKVRGGDTAPLLDRIARLEQQVKDLAAENQQLKQQLADLQAQYALVEQRLRQGQPGEIVFFQAMVPTSCPGDAFEVVFSAAFRDGSSATAVRLVPWDDDASDLILNASVKKSSYGTNNLRESTTSSIELANPISLDVYLRFKSREAFERELQRLAQAYADLKAKGVPSDVFAKRAASACLLAVSGFTSSGPISRTFRISVFEPVVPIVRMTVDASRKFTFANLDDDPLQRTTRITDSLCASFKEHCELARRVAQMLQQTK